jgi:DNA uptake protein ComE-like DNA-binding protein
MAKRQINLVNPQELLEIPGINKAMADAILRHRAQHGPIRDAAELIGILGQSSVTKAVLEHIDFAPAPSTAPEAPGA